MGFFNDMKSNYKKAEAAVVVQNLLEHQAKAGTLNLDPAALANKLVAAVWQGKPDVFDGKFGQRPHKISVAAAALGLGVHVFKDDDPNKIGIVLALGNVISEVEANGRLYPLHGVDEVLLETAMSVFGKVANESPKSSLSGVKDGASKKPNHSTWEEWYGAFKITAGRFNSVLEPDADGLSLIDLMEHEPLERAFRDGIGAEFLAKEFAETFDITEFGLKR